MIRPPTMEAAAKAGRTGASLWRYVAVNGQRAQQRGELMAETAADVRASLRRIGLQVIDVKPMKQRRRPATPATGTTERDHKASHAGSFLRAVGDDVFAWWCRRCRAQRASNRAEFYDSLSTMLASGLPLLEAMQTLVESRDEDHVVVSHANESRSNSKTQSSSSRAVFVQMREQLRGGESLAESMRGHPTWFDAIDIAIVEAGQHSGMLADVLAGLAQRQERSSEVAHKLVGALAYPLLVMLVGLGVVVFLSVKTLPDLTKILVDAKIPIPALTAKVMWFGQMLASHWLTLVIAIVGLGGALIVLPRIFARSSASSHPWFATITSRLGAPRFVRRMLIGSFVGSGGLADLLRSGVPMVEALRVLAPAQRSPHLRKTLLLAAERVERGEELSAAFDDRRWFDAEMRRLLDIGQASGELDDMLLRIGARYERRAKRLIDRMTAFLEPAVLLLLAVMVGTVVMAAILPLIALQQIIK